MFRIIHINLIVNRPIPLKTIFKIPKEKCRIRNLQHNHFKIWTIKLIQQIIIVFKTLRVISEAKCFFSQQIWFYTIIGMRSTKNKYLYLSMMLFHPFFFVFIGIGNLPNKILSNTKN